MTKPEKTDNFYMEIHCPWCGTQNMVERDCSIDTCFECRQEFEYKDDGE